MKRLLLIGMLFALLVGDRGGVLAAMLCPHAKSESLTTAKKHACCRVEAAHEADAHCSASSHEAMGGMEMMSTVPAVEGHAQAFGPEPPASCAHCVEQSGLPNTPILALNVAEQLKRDVSTAPVQVFRPLGPLTATFLPPVAARQGAPPGVSTRRHVLFSVFLI